MTEPSSDDANVLKSFDTALWLLSARRQDIDVSQWTTSGFGTKFGDYAPTQDDPVKYLESVGNLISSLTASCCPLSTLGRKCISWHALAGKWRS